jgi:hypothetical protein
VLAHGGGAVHSGEHRSLPRGGLRNTIHPKASIYGFAVLCD